MAFPQDELCPKVHARFGDEWVDLSTRLRDQISVRYGGQSEGPTMPPARVTFDLVNEDGDLSPENPLSPHWPHIDLGVQIRVELPAGMVDNGDARLFFGELAEWQPYWPDGLEDEARVAVTAAGVLERLSKEDQPLESAMVRHYLAYGDLLYFYLPLEDGPDSLTAANLAEGAGPFRGAIGDEDTVRRPGFGRDDSMPGSAPLPDWPNLTYFDWEYGGTPRAFGEVGDVRYILQVSVRVPADTGEAWLVEWLTPGGTYTLWQLKVNSGGSVELFSTNENDAEGATPTTDTYTSTAGAIDDGAWRTISVMIRSAGSSGQGVYLRVDGTTDTFSDSATVAPPFRIRPRPMIATITDDTEPIGLGHTAVMVPATSDLAEGTRILDLMPPVDGHSGERAIRRIERLCAEEDIPVEIVWDGVAELSDEFDREVSNGWGTSTSGRAWTTSGTASAFAVADGEGTIDPTTTARYAYVDDELTDLRVSALVGYSDGVDADAVLMLRRVDSNDWYEAALTLLNTAGDLSLSLVLWRLSAGSYTSLGSVDVADLGTSLDSTARWHLDFEVEGTTLRARAWPQGERAPEWMLEITDTTHISGGYGAGAFSAGSPVTVAFDNLVAVADPSARLGVQQRATLLANLEAAAESDHGILFESRTELGLVYRPLASLYNQDPIMELSCHGDGEGEPGQIDADYTPSLDNSMIRNDRTVNRQGGSSYRAVLESGRRSVLPPPDGVGRYPDQVTLSLATDAQLSGQAGWLLHLGTIEAMRLPLLPIDLAWSPDLIPAWAAARLGDRIDLVGLPRQQHAPMRIKIDGWSSVMTATDWRVSINASPYGPYEVGIVAAADGTQDVRGQAVDTDHSTVSAAGLYVPGSSGNNASTPDHASLDITGDLDLRAEAVGNWGTAADIRVLAAKWDTDISPGNGSYYLSLNATGQLRLTWSTTGANFVTRVATALPEPTADRLAVRATLDVDNGAGQHVVTFYTSDSIDGPWTQLGSPVVTAGTTSVFSGNARLEVGARSQGTIQPWVGQILAVQVYSGIGTLVADGRFDEQTTGTASFADSTGKTWTVHGTAAITNGVTDSDTTLYVHTDIDHPLRGLWTTDSDDWDTSSTTTKGIIVAWPGSAASIPAGWRRVEDLDGRYPKGVPDALAVPGDTGGAAAHSHGIGAHSHSVNHSHSTPTNTGTPKSTVNRDPGGSVDDAHSANHVHTWPSTGTSSVQSGATVPPVAEVANDPIHVEVIWIEALEAATGLPDDAVALYAGETLPTDHNRVYDGRYLKGAPANGDGGTTGAGSTSHTHDIDAHTHDGTSHSHTSPDSGTEPITTNLDPGSHQTLRSDHWHEINIGSQATAPLASAAGGTSGSGDADEPPHCLVTAMQNVSGGTAAIAVGTIAAWMGTADTIPTGWALCDGADGTPDLMGRYPRGAADASEHGTTGGSEVGHDHTGASHSHTTSSHSHSASTSGPQVSGFSVSSGQASGGTAVAHNSHTHNMSATNQTTPSVGSSSTGSLQSATTEPEHTTVLWIIAVDTGAALTALTDGPPRNGGGLVIEVAGEHMTVASISGDVNPQVFTVERGTNEIRKPHEPGTQVRVAYPARVAL